MSEVRLSMIVTVYNKAPFLRRCLDAIAEQLCEGVQVIVIDDCSTDGGGKICDEYKKKFEIWHAKKNGGVSNARNIGLEMAQGEYVTFVDSDDVLAPDAIKTMLKAMELEYNIIQFAHWRRREYTDFSVLENIRPRIMIEGFYGLDYIPRYWVMVWNKIYKRSFIEKNNIRFIVDMDFGEDTIFSAECILANKGLWHVPKGITQHIIDDKNSLCRGNLTKERLMKLDEKLCELRDAQSDQGKKRWVKTAIDEHRNSQLFKKYCVGRDPNGKYDVVYFVKDCIENEELRYSLRSLEDYWRYNKVWFCGGCPNGIKPDRHFKVEQRGNSKWDRVRNMIIDVCNNDEITENFWLFNDDFYILKPRPVNMLPKYNGELIPYIERIERKHGPDDFTIRLRKANNDLRVAGKTTFNYEVHKPMLINRKKALEVFDKFPDTPAFRSLYGNYWQIGGEHKHDMKIKLTYYGKMHLVEEIWDFLSSSDISFNQGNVGEFIRRKFNKPSRFEE